MPSDVMVWAANLKSMPGIIEQRNVRTDELVAKPLNY
jgi:hypothetical protein